MIHFSSISSNFPLDILELNGNPLGDAWLLHGNPIKDIGNAHGNFVVGDDEELRVAGEFL